MSEVLFVKNLLETNWAKSVSGRSNDVPQPTFVLEKSKRKERLSTQDVGYVRTGGDTTREIMSLGATHDSVDTTVVIELRAETRKTDSGVLENGYKRLFGDRNGPNGLQAPDDWSGLTGEASRVLRADRKGRAEWDVIGHELRIVDQDEVGGVNYWRADVFVPMIDVADEIDTST